jgi:hypothetical protein
MEWECRAEIERQDEENVWLRWSLAERGRDVPPVEGRVRFDLETVQFFWEGGRPPAEHEFLVRTTVDRMVRAR